MAKYRGWVPEAAGAQRPEKYPFVGPHYREFGEVKGYIYDPWSDTYKKDPKAAKEYYQKQGLIAEDPEVNETSATGQLLRQGLLAAIPVATKEIAGPLGLTESKATTGTEGLPSGGLLKAFGVTSDKVPGVGGVPGEYTGESVPMIGSEGSFFNTEGAFGTEGLGGLGVGNYLGAGLGGYGMYDATQKQSKGAGVAQGALSGAAAGLSLGGPWGAGIGAIVGGALGLLSHKTTKERERERWQSVGRNDLASSMEGHDYFAGTGGEDSRDESFLTADSIRINPENYNLFGNDWDNMGLDAQDEFLNYMLQNGAVREKQGGIYYDDDLAAKKADEVRAKYANGATATSTGSQSSGSGSGSSDSLISDALSDSSKIKKNVTGSSVEEATPATASAIAGLLSAGTGATQAHYVGIPADYLTRRGVY